MGLKRYIQALISAAKWAHFSSSFFIVFNFKSSGKSCGWCSSLLVSHLWSSNNKALGLKKNLSKRELQMILWEYIYIYPWRATSINQKQAITTQTRLNVTVSLYLSPDNRARSLSTLMVAHVRSDTAGSREKTCQH